MIMKIFVLTFILLAITKPIFADDSYDEWLHKKQTREAVKAEQEEAKKLLKKIEQDNKAHLKQADNDKKIKNKELALAKKVLLSKSLWSESRERFDYIQMLNKSENSQVLKELERQTGIMAVSCVATYDMAGVTLVLSLIPGVSRSASYISDYFEPSHITPMRPHNPPWREGHELDVWMEADDRAAGSYFGILMGVLIDFVKGGNNTIKGAVDPTPTMLKAIYSEKSWSTCSIARRKFAEVFFRLENMKKTNITNPAAVMDDSRSNFKPTDTQPESAKKTAEKGVGR